MPETPLKNQIIAWLEEYPYWLQFAGNKILEGENLLPALVEETYQFFLEDSKLTALTSVRNEVVFVEVAENAAEAAELLLLQHIKDIENVNALISGQAITISPNLTIIYGVNGAGKSGYIRLLNNAFKSRGDKNILANVFGTGTTGEPSCKFVFQSETSYELQYPLQRDNREFSQYSVFDTECVRVQLEEENGLIFTPSGFDFFNKIISLYESLKDKLNIDIKRHRPNNEFEPLFINENIIREHILVLGVATDEDKLKQLGTYTEEDTKQLEILIGKKTVLQALDIPKKIAELQKLQFQLTTFMENQQAILGCLKPSDIDYYNTLIKAFGKFQELAKQEGIKSLEAYNIDEVGSVEWREFINAAKGYALAIEEKREGNISYPSDDDLCVFCLQPLTDKESVLINSYWNLLKSEAEAELNRTIKKIKDEEKKLKGLVPVQFDETNTLFTFINSINQPLAVKWKEIVSISEITRQNIIHNLANKKIELEVKPFTESVNEFDVIVQKIKEEITNLINKNPTAELAAIEKEIKFFNDKNLLSKLLDKILAFVSAHKWALKAEQALSAFRLNSLTILQGKLFTEHITDRYTEIFNEECLALDAPNVVHINQRNSKGQTLRKLQVAGQSANRILSEGEQRAISLADFLTEVQLNKINKGIIFDDPVTSLDHQRKEKIAERLVQEASARQVIIFTHDISFLIQLQIIAETITGLQFGVTTMRKVGNNIGIINPDLPWVAQKVKDRIGYLRNGLVKLKKMEKDGLEDEYNFAVKSWYGLLREAWERAIEERLFKGVIERFAFGIQTQKLKKLEITPAMLDEIEKGMTQASKWVHDQAAGLNPTIPDSAKTESDLNFFDEFAKKCVAA